MQEIMAQAAHNLGTLAILARDRLAPLPGEALGLIMPSYSPGSLSLDDPLLSQVQSLEILDHPGVLEQVETLKKRYPQVIVSIKIPGDEKVVTRVAELTAAGAEIIHIYASEQAQGLGDFQDLHLKDLIRRCHLRLVEDQLRDTVTLLVSGGIALAEHVAKAIICGADGVIADLPLLLALECRLCRQCAKRGKCPVEIDQLSVKRGAQRLVNLMGAWNNQLLEILGAMGMREVRRLRGEVGRAMFLEDLEKEIFAPLFATREGELKREPT
jgi:glutamate synthase domain-containing protein 2